MAHIVQLDLGATPSPRSRSLHVPHPLSLSSTAPPAPNSFAFVPATPSTSGHSSGTFSRHQHQLYVEASPPTSPNGSGGTGVGGGTWQLFAPSTPRTIAAGSVTLTRTGSGDSVGVSDVDVGGSAGAPGTRLTESRSRSRLRSREGAYSPNTVMRAGGAYVVPKGGYTNKIRDSSLCGGALREDSFEHVNTRSMRENIDWIAGVSHPAPTAQIIRPFAGYNVGRSAPPDPYNIKGANLWRDRTRAQTWSPVGPDGTGHDGLREDWVRSEPSAVHAAEYPRSRSTLNRHPDRRCSSPEKMHPAVLAPKSTRRSQSIAHASLRDMQSMSRRSDGRGTLGGGGMARANSPTFRGRITVRHQDVTSR